jgi:hypothetical protein
VRQCGSARGSVWMVVRMVVSAKCAQQCVAVRLVLYGCARGSVHAAVQQCAAMRQQCAAVRQCDCGSVRHGSSSLHSNVPIAFSEYRPIRATITRVTLIE